MDCKNYEVSKKFPSSVMFNYRTSGNGFPTCFLFVNLQKNVGKGMFSRQFPVIRVGILLKEISI